MQITIYRLFDAEGRTLYVGQTWNGGDARLRQHRAARPWGDRIAGWETLATVDPLYRNEATRIEARFIQLLQAPYNKQRTASDTPDRDLPTPATLWPAPDPAGRMLYTDTPLRVPA